MHEKRVTEDPKIIPYERRKVQTSEVQFEPPVSFPGLAIEHQPSIAYWHTLLRRRWTIVTIVAVLTTLTAIASFKMKPVYESTALVEVDSETPQVQSLSDAYQQFPMDQDFLRTQIEVLKTDNLAWRTIEQLGLRDNPEFASWDSRENNDSNRSESHKIQLIRTFKKHLTVDLLPGSRIVQVSFESTDPALAAKVSNALVDNYLDYNFREKYDATRVAGGRMEEQLDELKAKVEKSQGDLVDYQRQHAIVDVNDKQSVVEQRLGELSSQLTTAQSERIQKESLYTESRTNPEKIASLAQNELLQKIEEKQSDIKKEYVEALSQYGPTFPKALRLQKQVDELESQISKERSRVVERIGRDYSAAVVRESLLADAVSRQKGELGEFNKLLVQQNILKGEFDTNQKLYERLLEHLKDATVSAGLKSTNIHPVDAALAPIVPVRPKKLSNIGLALVVSLLIGTALAFVQERLDHSVKSMEDVEGLISAPVLAVIPASRSLPRLRPQIGNGNGKALNTNGHLGLEVLNQKNSALAESFKALRTATLLSMAARPPQIMLVTSANAGEGKTTTALNLALSLAQQQGEVLLVDCDLRKPGIATSLGLSGEIGVSSVLTGRESLTDILCSYGPLPNLWTLTSGPKPPNPAELLSSSSMAEMLNELRARFRHIVLDSPPVLMVTDAAVLSPLVDGVILVIESGITPRNAVVRSCKILQGAGANILGVALNKVNVRLDGNYGSYGYHSYYYRDDSSHVNS
jgi:polysaccharide biosynthesis transport protein